MSKKKKKKETEQQKLTNGRKCITDKPNITANTTILACLPTSTLAKFVH
jgi:hypothetical protein